MKFGMKTKLHLDREGKTKSKLCTQLPAREKEGGEEEQRAEEGGGGKWMSFYL